MRTVMELASVGTWELDLKTDRRTFSKEMRSMLGHPNPKSEAELYSHFHPDDAAAGAGGPAARHRRALGLPGVGAHAPPRRRVALVRDEGLRGVR